MPGMKRWLMLCISRAYSFSTSVYFFSFATHSLCSSSSVVAFFLCILRRYLNKTRYLHYTFPPRLSPTSVRSFCQHNEDWPFLMPLGFSFSFIRKLSFKNKKNKKKDAMNHTFLSKKQEKEKWLLFTPSGTHWRVRSLANRIRADICLHLLHKTLSRYTQINKKKQVASRKWKWRRILRTYKRKLLRSRWHTLTDNLLSIWKSNIFPFLVLHMIHNVERVWLSSWNGASIWKAEKTHHQKNCHGKKCCDAKGHLLTRIGGHVKWH